MISSFFIGSKIKSSTKNAYLKVKNYSKLKISKNKNLALRKNLINLVVNSKNDLQSVKKKA